LCQDVLVKDSPKAPEHVSLKTEQGKIRATWKPVKNTTTYEIQALEGLDIIDSWSVENSVWDGVNSELSTRCDNIRVRAWLDDEPSEWASIFRVSAKRGMGLANDRGVFHLS
jgi:hypothetical protein